MDVQTCVVQTCVVQLFDTSCKTSGSDPNLLKELEKLFVNTNWITFNKVFQDQLTSVIFSKKNTTCGHINNMIEFAAKSISILSNYTPGLNLLSQILKLSHDISNANKDIRWRVCLFYYYYLSNYTNLSKEIGDAIIALMMDRLQDKNSKIRVQAVHVLNTLQKLIGPQVRIVKLMSNIIDDPNIKVRTTVVKNITMIDNVVDLMLKYSLIDGCANVRNEAYQRFLEYPFLWLSTKQRQAILNNGLVDTSSSINSLVNNQLLKKWLQECNNDCVLFLENLEVTNEVICEKALNSIFNTNYNNSKVFNLIKKYLNSDSRMIAIDELTAEKCFLWKCIAKYLNTKKKNELAFDQGHVEDYYIDLLLPDLLTFFDYIKEYNSYSKYSNEFILTQLLDITSTFSIDHVEAKHINKFCLELILNDKVSVKPIKSVTLLLDLAFKNRSHLLNYVGQIVNKIQRQIIDVYPLIKKVGKKELSEHQIYITTEKVNKLLKNKPIEIDQIELLTVEIKKYKQQCNKINVVPEEKKKVDKAVKNALKVLKLIYHVQNLPKVDTKLSELKAILNNFNVAYLDCSMVNLRMAAIRSLTPICIFYDVVAARSLLCILCAEMGKPLNDKHFLFKTMFKLFLRYEFKELEKNKNNEIQNILEYVVNFIDYYLDDSSYKSIIVKGYCDLLLVKKFKSTSLLTKLMILWARKVSCETLNTNAILNTFFSSFAHTIDISSSELAKCYVPFLKEIDDQNLVKRLDIAVDTVNSNLIEMTQGLMYKYKKGDINAHTELACYILDYLLDENQPYTAMLLKTLNKLKIDFDNNIELASSIDSKLLCVIEHLKKLDAYKDSLECLENIKNKLDPVLQNKMEVDVIELDKSQTQVTSTSSQLPVLIEVYNLSTHENIIVIQNSDDESMDTSLLDAMKRVSEVSKKSSNAQTYDVSSSDSDSD